MNTRISVIGGANVDLSATLNDTFIAADSNPGHVEVGYGGVARNIAHNLALLGTDVQLLTVFGGDLFGGLLYDFCRQQGIGFISFSPLAQGLLTDRYLNGIPEGSRMSRPNELKRDVLTSELLDHLHHLNQQAAQRGETLAEMALAWVLSQQGVTSVLVGASSVAQLATNMRCVHAAPVAGF